MENEESMDFRQMRRDNRRTFRRMRHNPNDKTGGIVLIAIGIIFLLSKIPVTESLIPHWILTWPMILIAIGLVTAIKSKFRNPSWFILMIIGGYFLMLNNGLMPLNLRPYIFPLGLILLGIFIIIKKNRRCHPAKGRFRQWDKDATKQAWSQTIDSNEDIVNMSSVFGNIERNIFSKNFKGGTISTVFGGAQVNFSQTDFEGTAIIDVSVIFGGVDIIIPANWNLKNEMSVVFGGIEDRRTVAPNVNESGKTLILKGDIIFGGIEIKSY